jgi:hypothetical protein
MAERSTLLARPSNAPTTQPTQTGAVQGSFGDYRGITALGQGLSSAGATGMDYAMNTKRDIENRQKEMKKEFENRRMEDHRLTTTNLVKTAALGVRKKWEAALGSGEKIDDPYIWMEQAVNEARTASTEMLSDVADDPLFQKAVPKAMMDQQWLNATDNLLNEAARYDGHVRKQARRESADIFVSTSFTTVDTGQHEAVLSELSGNTKYIDSMLLDPGEKYQLRRQLADRGYDKILGGIQLGVRAPEAAINNPLFNPGQQNMIRELNLKLDKSPLKPGEASTVLNDSLDKARSTANLNDFTGTSGKTMQLMAEAVSAEAITPEAKRYPFAKIELAKKFIELTRNNFNEGILKGPTLYQRLTNLSASIGDPKTAEALYDSLGIKGAKDTDRSQFMTEMKAVVEEQLSLINTGKANVLIDRSDAVAPVASAVTADFNAGVLNRGSAERYIFAAREQYRQLGIPDNLQVLVPAAIAGTMTDRVWNGDNGNAVKMMTDIGSNFGADALGSIANHFLAPTNAPKTGSAVDGTKARAGAYAALIKIASADHARTEIGAASRELDPFLKTWMDDLSNYTKNEHTFAARSRQVAEIVFNNTSFNDPALAKEMLSASQFTTITSKAQSLPGIALGLYWHHGQNNDLSTGFKEMMMRIIQARAYSAGSQDQGSDNNSREVVADNVGMDINKALAGVYTVVPSAGFENNRRVYDLWPTKLVAENAFAVPINFGAADVADMSDQLANVLTNIGYYEPRREWDRGFLGNYQINFSNFYGRDNPFFAAFLSGGSDAVKSLPAHLAVDWASVAGITPQQASTPGRKSEDVFKDFLNNSPVRATMNSVAFVQNGAWRYNWRTGYVEAMIFPGRSETPAGPSVETPGAAQVLRHNSGAPVAIKAEDIRKFDTAYRTNRVSPYFDNTRPIPSKESQFVTPPLN